MNGKVITTEDLFGEVLVLERAITSLKNKLLSIMPAKYGSDAWWKESDKKAMEDIKVGKYKSFSSVKALVKELNS